MILIPDATIKTVFSASGLNTEWYYRQAKHPYFFRFLIAEAAALIKKWISPL